MHIRGADPIPGVGEDTWVRPRVDVVLERKDGLRRLWIEFEVSRADPVANHAKYATTHLFQPRPSSDTFVAMVSPHVDRGRRNLAANTIALMRGVGLSAFQTPLLPHCTGEEVKRLNHLAISELMDSGFAVKPEIDRALAVSAPVLAMPECSLHFAGDLLDVVLNVQRWNREIRDEALKARWGRRLVTYFVFDAVSGLFAPSKFCAYTLIGSNGSGSRALEILRGGMNIAHYVTLDGSERRFDGRLARLHLTKRLGVAMRPLREMLEIHGIFQRWLEAHSDSIAIHPNGPAILQPPGWFR